MLKKIISIFVLTAMLFTTLVLVSCNGGGKLPQTGDTEAKTGPITKPPPEPGEYPGGVGIGTWNANVYFDDIKVIDQTSGKRETLYENNFEEANPMEGFNYSTHIGGAWAKSEGDLAVIEIAGAEAAEGAAANKVLEFKDDTATGSMIWFGDNKWEFYQLALKVNLVKGASGAIIYFGVQDDQNYYALNIGGETGKNIYIEKVSNGKKEVDSFKVPYELSYEKWFNVSLNVNKKDIDIYVDSVLLFAYGKDIREQDVLKGGIGFGAWATKYSLDNIKVTKNDTGEVLYENNFDDPATLNKDKFEAFVAGDGWWDNKETWEQDWRVVADTDSESGHGNILKLSYESDKLMNGAALMLKESMNNPEKWNNYTLSVDCLKDSGDEGFMIHFAFLDDRNFVRWNQGGSGNTISCFQVAFDNKNPVAKPNIKDKYEVGQWYHMDIILVQNRVYAYVDGVLKQTWAR